jgi:hypoxanthine phosphoribosyltransferase
MDCVMTRVKSLGAASVKSCVLLNKPLRRKINITPDYCCFEIPDLFVVGYGLNYGDYYRNIPYVFNWEE